MCDKHSDEIIKNLIYKNKVVVFGFSNDEFTKKSINFFQERYNHNTTNLFLDKLDFPNKSEENLFLQCLSAKSKSNVVPMIYLNGMFLGHYNSLSNYEYRRDLDIFF
jgi:hypothetical protein